MILAVASVALAGPELERPLEEREALAPTESVSISELPPVLDPAAVPVWPDMRRFRRHHDAAWIGLATGTVGGILLAAALPDRGRLLQFDVGCLASGFACPISVARP